MNFGGGGGGGGGGFGGFGGGFGGMGGGMGGGMPPEDPYEDDADVIEVTRDNFPLGSESQQFVWLVQFYTPGSEQAQSFAPKYKQVGIGEDERNVACFCFVHTFDPSVCQFTYPSVISIHTSIPRPSGRRIPPRSHTVGRGQLRHAA
jgi:hypothetical protein